METNDNKPSEDLPVKAESTTTETQVETNAAERPKKSRRKLLIILGVVAVVLVGLAVGGLIWHEQPSFCNAICHSPMDSYVEGFESGDATLLVSTHATAGDDCLDCHETDIGQQLEELGTWVSGDFKDPLPMTKTGTQEFCLRCHDDGNAATGKDWDAIVEATVNYNGTARNPHASHYGDALECYTCHRVHRASVMYCNQCHPDISGPDTWES